MSSAPQEVREARLALGRKLAGLRKAAGYTQNSLAPLTLYGRSTVANVELGRQSVGRDFWVRCDQILDTGGALAADYDRMQARARQLDRLSALRGLPWPSGPDHADGEDVDGRSPLRAAGRTLRGRKVVCSRQRIRSAQRGLLSMTSTGSMPWDAMPPATWMPTWSDTSTTDWTDAPPTTGSTVHGTRYRECWALWPWSSTAHAMRSRR
ncbi:transcriptional regulator [Verrucosispora sp. ts21]|uniref:helix-turn-helix domain-containing protein n=1 Tax=Verrucosispora sp. ts21 TaxID=2069341 RepID=UPI000C883389|nr:helix-turn-helix transcriptional regulator [Verrucosispora sp. ts21]PMR62100.1 transcriptional regulator [Verrucosispora sp. ts21]